MIRYRVTLAELEQLIDGEDPKWRGNAGDRTKLFKKKRAYAEESSIWSDVKVVYMRLQGNCKCAFCERKLESVTYGKGEEAVEHFRPKKRVKAWPLPAELVALGIKGRAAPKNNRGYYLLPYHLFNYSASCIPCNSALKGDYFPIAGAYKMSGGDPGALMNERPYLIYLIGDFDDDPQALIQFHGTSPQPVAAAGHPRNRALVTIAFFHLDDMAGRENLFRERASIIVALHPQLEKANGNGPPAEKAAADALVKGFTSPKAPHTNCAKSFERLFHANPAEARSVFDKASAYVASTS